MIGFSLYFDREFNIEEDLRSYKDFDLLFTSIHYPAGEETFKKFLDLYEATKDTGIRICVDLNKEVLKTNPNLLDMDLIIRLDYGFTAKDIGKLSKTNKISINASTIDEDFLEDILANGAVKENIIAIHNYYPLEFTGLGPEYFVKRNELFNALGIELATFIPGNLNLRGPIYKSLPTLEAQRLKNPYLAYIELKRGYGQESIILAEGLDEKSLAYIKDFENKKKITLKVYLEDEYKDITGFKQRDDLSEYILRNEREYKKIKANPPQDIKPGDILICNEKAGRYSGEIEICKKHMGLVDDRNVIGRVYDDYQQILAYIEGGDEIVFDRG